MEDIVKSIGLKLKTVRMRLGLSQQNVADDLGISATAFSKIENGKTNISVRRLYQISIYYHIFMSDLFDPRREIPRWLDQVDDLTDEAHEYLNRYVAGLLNDANRQRERGR